MTIGALPLDSVPDPWIDELSCSARRAAGDVQAALALSRTLGPSVPLPGSGATLKRWQVLAGVAAADLTVARVLEPHLDALAVLAEAGVERPAATWGVFAAESTRDPLRATRDGAGYRLWGTKHWCSLAGVLDRALVSAHVEGGRRLFDVDLHHRGVDVEPAESWISRGLAAVTSGRCSFDGVPAAPVGELEWYVERSGFAHGAIGVAACWFGAAAALRSTLLERATSEDVGFLLTGQADRACWAASAALEVAARRIDDGDGVAHLAARTTGIVAEAAEDVLRCVTSGLGPEPLCFDEIHARRAADLHVYLRQHHAERTMVRLGRALKG